MRRRTGRVRMMTGTLRSSNADAMRPPRLPAPQTAKVLYVDMIPSG
jgi:hypothetical protein